MNKICGTETIELNSGFNKDTVVFEETCYPYIEIKSDGKYEVYASKFSINNMICIATESGDNIFAWDKQTTSSVKYLSIKLLSGSFLTAKINSQNNK